MCHDWIVDVFSKKTRSQGSRSREMELSYEDIQARGRQHEHAHNELRIHNRPAALIYHTHECCQLARARGFGGCVNG